MGHPLARNRDRINDWKLDGEGARGGCQSAYPNYGLELSRGVKDGQKGLKEREYHMYVQRHSIHTQTHT